MKHSTPRQWRTTTAAIASLALAAGSCGGGGSKQRESTPAPITVSEADASRFLARSTYGADDASITAVRRLGYGAWIDRQLDLPATLHTPPLRKFAEPNNGQRIQIWMQQSRRSPDQLRQRVAFALSQIFVVSMGNDELEDLPELLADYYDRLVEGAFGSYRDLLEEVTLHPAMGIYLSMVKNRAPTPGDNRRPDENYAREVMQLFSIGLFELNPDGSPKRDSKGAKIPTYDQSVIVGTAHAFTGWNFAEAPAALNEWLEAGPSEGNMEPWDRYHDRQPKTLLGGFVGRAGETTRQDLATVLDLLAAHPNVGPFIGKQLIQRLVTSNPSPAYVARVSAVFDDDGTGTRGNLGAVVKAILMDPEAMDGRTQRPEEFGKLREPLLRFIAVLRAFGLKSNGPLDIELNEAFAQAPLAAPSVFNFYRPDYTNATLRARQLVAPELQIITHAQIQRTVNEMTYWLLDDEAPQLLDLAPLAALAGTPDLLLDRLDTLLLGGTLSSESRRIIQEHLTELDPGEELAREALFMTVVSPDFAVQR